MQKKIYSKKREALSMLWELIPKFEKRYPGYSLVVNEAAQAFENFLENNTDAAYNEVCNAHKSLSGLHGGLQAYEIKVGDELPGGEGADIFYIAFVPALLELLSTAWMDENDDCEQKIQTILKDFEVCRNL